MNAKLYRYYYYVVDVPSDVCEDETERGEIAINQAREMAKIYHSPALWYVVRSDSQTVTVCKKVHNTKK